MADGVIDIGGGLTLTPSTAEDFAYVNSHLRDGDRAEREVFGEDERIENYERVWTVRDGDDILAFVGYLPFADEGRTSRRRYLAGLTTEAVWKRKIKFVRRSPDVVNAALCTMPPFVTEVYTNPMKEYRGAVRWLERVLGFTPLAENVVNGVPHVLMVRRKRLWQ